MFGECWRSMTLVRKCSTTKNIRLAWGAWVLRERSALRARARKRRERVKKGETGTRKFEGFRGTQAELVVLFAEAEDGDNVESESELGEAGDTSESSTGDATDCTFKVSRASWVRENHVARIIVV